MIEFKCPKCSRPMKVADEHAGKTGKCKGCSTPVKIPSPRVKALEPEIEELDDEFDLPAPVVPRTPARKSRQPRVVVPNQVNVHVDNRQPTNGTGIATLVVGIVGLCFFWMPYVGCLIGALGCLLAIIGLIIGLTRKGAGLGYAIGGGVISLLALIVGIPSTVVGTAIVHAANKTAEDLAKQNRPLANQAQQPQAPAVPPPVNNAGAPAAAPVAAPLPPPPAPKLAGVGEPFVVGDLEVTVESASIGKVPMKGIGGEGESKDEYLMIVLSVANKSMGKKMDFRTWSSRNLLGDFSPDLNDDVGNSYKRISEPFGEKFLIVEKTDSSIYPGKRTQDAVVFEVPVDSAKSVKLRLPGKAIGIEGVFEFEIPSDKIERK